MSIWLDRVNYYRGLADVSDVAEDANLSAGDDEAAEYMVMNNVITHIEDSNNQYYTSNGANAAYQSDLAVYYTALPPQTQMVDEWMTGAFHGPNIIDPQMQTIGFGTFQDLSAPGYKSATALNVVGGIPPDASGGFPVEWPGDGHIVSLTSYSMYGSETPDARTSCAGYANANAGLPITLQLGYGYGITSPDPTSSGYDPGQSSVTLNGNPLSFCEIDGYNYINTVQTDFDWQTWGRNVLKGQGTIVLLPQHVLAPGTYSVVITVSGTSYSWQFTVAAAAVPTVSGISQSSGLVSGGTSVTISGTGFTGAYAVYFGTNSVPATNFTVNNDSQITVTSPAATSPGVVDIMVATPGGISATSSADQFSYLGALQFCCLDIEGGLWYAGYPASGGSWPLSFSELSAQSTGGSALQFKEIAGEMVGTALHICGIDNTGVIWHAIYSASGPLSFDQVSAQSPGNQPYTKLGCAGTPAGSLHICAIDANGFMYHDVHTSTSPSWALAFTNNVNQLSNAGAMTFEGLACATIQEDLHIAALAPDTYLQGTSLVEYTSCTVANGTSSWQPQFVDVLGWKDTIHPKILAVGCAALNSILHVYPIVLFSGGSIWHTSCAVTVPNSTWQPVDQDPTNTGGQVDMNNQSVSCTSWGTTIQIAYGFPWVPGISPAPANQSLYHTSYSTGWSTGFDTVLTQGKAGNYFSKVSLVGG